MKDKNGVVLYVGKAKNLRQRVKQYFMIRGDERVMIPFLVAKIAVIDTIVVMSEKEAFLLENTLIKQHRPKYNALLKDDKTYIALKINHKHDWPMLSLVRYRGSPKPDGQYFGPYTSGLAARETLELLRRLFPLRQCSDQELSRRTRPCILYDMKRCIAPCVHKCTKEEYDEHVRRTVKFLRGQDKEVLQELKTEMQQASDHLDFERAGVLYHQIQQIEKTLETQSVDKPLGVDADVLAIFREGDEVLLTQLIFRGGKLLGSKNYDFSSIAEEDDELLESFLLQHYQTHQQPPKEILLPLLPEGYQALEEILSTDKRNVYISAPQRGEKKNLVDMAQANAEANFRKQKDAQGIRERTLMEMKEKLHLKNYPRKIECFDNSNMSGDQVVSTLVSFVNGLKDTSGYRKYKIRGQVGSDDYAAMREALQRRYKRAKEENNLPDLLMIDGGKGHLNVALKVMSELDIISIDLIGVAKEEGRHDRGATEEQIFLPNIKDPVFFKRTSPILFLLQQIRDEAHRTAISYQRKLRVKKNMRSALENIPGIGIGKRNSLLKHFGSVKGVKEASILSLQEVKGISKSNAEAIYNFFHSD